jgi:two-component system, cell cycle sensor histidine kinase and response regulator CckA
VSQAVGQTILLAEDDETLRHLTETVLSGEGYRVLAAANGAEALTLAREHLHQIHLVVTDLVMPVLDGGGLASELRLLQPDLPILFMSGYAVDLPLGDDEQAGAALLKKPFVPSELLARVARMLRR